MIASKSKTKKLRMALTRQGIMSIAEFARLIPCARTSIYLALERPQRFPNVTNRINQVMEESND